MRTEPDAAPIALDMAAKSVEARKADAAPTAVDFAAKTVEDKAGEAAEAPR